MPALPAERRCDVLKAEQTGALHQQHPAPRDEVEGPNCNSSDGHAANKNSARALAFMLEGTGSQVCFKLAALCQSVAGA